MTGLSIILIWLIAPFVELGVIIGLAVERGRDKRRIRELEEEKGKSAEGVSGLYGNSSLYGSSGLYGSSEQGSNSRAVSYPSGYGVWPENIQKVNECIGFGTGEQKNDTEREEENRKGSIGEESRESGVGGENRESGVGEENGESGVEEENRESCGENGHSYNLGTAALGLGVIFIVLAGLIFGTTSWHMLKDVHKVLLIFSSGAVFFGASVLAEQIFDIRRTSYAFYLLGSIFLFLSVLAVGYFRLLGEEFILEGKNRWRVLWVGSLVLEGAFLAGIKRFNDRLYTQASLWGMSVSMLFMAKALQAGWRDFLSMMTLYACGLLVFKEWSKAGKEREFSGEREVSARGLLLREMAVFVPLHFGIFSGCMMLCGFWEIVYGKGSWLGGAGMLAAVLGMGIFARRKKNAGLSLAFALAVVELFLYAAFLLPAPFAVRVSLAAIGEGIWFLFGRKKRGQKLDRAVLPDSRVEACLRIEDGVYTAALALKVCLLFSPLRFLWADVRFAYGLGEWAAVSAAAIVLAAMADEWGKEKRVIRMVIPFILWLLTISVDRSGVLVWEGKSIAYEAILFGFLCGMAWWDIRKKDCFGIPVLLMGASAQIVLFWDVGNERWWFFYTLWLAVYLLRYRKEKRGKKAALSVSACLFAAAFWQQPFITWPEWIVLEFNLLPVVGLIWAMGKIWEISPWMKLLQRAAYVFCLGCLGVDGCCSGLLVDALIADGCCLAVFIWGQVKKDAWWVRISGIMLLMIVLFMTKDFWLNISWWVYLLAAGIGLILFAAVNEKRKR